MDSGPFVFRRALGWAPVVGAWGLLVGLSLAFRPLLPIDETRYAAVAWEMWTRGDFLVPHLNGLPYGDKPPLLFWLIDLGWWLFGVSEGWARLVPQLFALINLFLTAALARRLWPQRPAVARAAPAILVGTLLWSVFTGALMFDMLVTFCVLAALLGLLRAWNGGGVLAWLQVGTALGLGVLAKGPVVFLPPLLVAVLVPWWGRASSARGPGWRWWTGLIVALGIAAVIALGWALPAAHAGGPRYANAILFAQTQERMVRSFAHRRPWWWYAALLPGLLYPYALWPPLWRALRRLRPRAADLGTRFCLVWTLVPLAAFSLISGKQPHYLLPLLPGFALLAARWLDEPAPAPARRDLFPALAGLLLLAAALVVVPRLGAEHHLPRGVAGISPLAGPALLLAAVACVVFFSPLFARRRSGPTVLTLAAVTVLYLGGAPAILPAYDVAPMARYLATAERQGRPIAYVGTYHGQFQFVGRLRRPIEAIPAAAARRWLRQHPRGRVVQELKEPPPGSGRPEFTQPYRTADLAVWSQDSFPPGW